MDPRNRVKNKKYLKNGNISYQMENKFTINEQCILELIFTYPSHTYSAREIARMTKLSHPTVLEALAKFEKLEIVAKILQRNQSKVGKSVFWAANQKSEKYKLFKKIANIQKIYFSTLIEKIATETSPNTIVLFGSYCRGEDMEDSDIDLFVQSKGKVIDLRNFEKKFARKINILFESNLNKLKKELLNNIINGIVFYGYLEVLK